MATAAKKPAEGDSDAPDQTVQDPDAPVGTVDNPHLIPAGDLAGSDGRPSVTIPRTDPEVRVVYDDVPDPETQP